MLSTAPYVFIKSKIRFGDLSEEVYDNAVAFAVTTHMHHVRNPYVTNILAPLMIGAKRFIILILEKIQSVFTGECHQVYT